MRLTSHLFTSAAVAIGVYGASQAQAAWTLLDNFDSYDNTAGTQTTAVTGGVWTAEFSGTANSNIIDTDKGQSLQTKGGAAWRGAERSLAGTDAAVLVGETQTFFWQVKAYDSSGAYTGANGFYDFMTGLAPSVSNIDQTNAYQDFSVMPFINNAAATPFINAAGSGTWWAPMATNTWHNLWVVVDNNATAPTYDLYYSTGTNAATLVSDNATWRNFPANQNLNAIGFMAAGAAGSEYQIDNIYFATGTDITNPVPEPAALSLLGLGALAMGRRRRI